jgi:hypothetical protein
MGAYEDAVCTLDRTPDTVAWIRAASGRAEHPDPCLPVIG